MQKLRQTIGLPVLETENGTQIGTVQEVLLQFDKALIVGVIIDGAGWFSQDRGILLGDVFSVGRDALMVRSAAVTREFDQDALSGLTKMTELMDKSVYAETGDCLGVLVDILFDQTTGEIKEWELSDGLLTDLLQGRLYMPLPPAQVINDDKIIVPEKMAELMRAVN